MTDGDWDDALQELLAAQAQPLLLPGSGVDECITLTMHMDLETAEDVWGAWCRYGTDESTTADVATVQSFLTGAMEYLGEWFGYLEDDDDDDEGDDNDDD